MPFHTRKRLVGVVCQLVYGSGVLVFSKGEGVVVYEVGSGKVLKSIDIANKRHWPGRFAISGKDLFWVNITGESVLRMDLDSYKFQVVAEGSRLGLAIKGDEIFLIEKGKLERPIDRQPSNHS